MLDLGTELEADGRLFIYLERGRAEWRAMPFCAGAHVLAVRGLRRGVAPDKRKRLK